MHNFWLPLHPDVVRPIGGVKQVHRLGEQLIGLGYGATIVQSDKHFRPGWFSSKVPTCSLSKGKVFQDLDPLTNTVILPETFIPFVPWYAPHLPKIVFNQNFSYTFGLRPGKDSFPDNPKDVLDLYMHPSIKSVWLVSLHNQAAFKELFDLNPAVNISRIVNSIESDIFNFGTKKKRQIAYMPRKNPKDCLILEAVLSGKSWFSDWRLVPIDGLSQPQVASVLKESLGYISTGHPEGFGLPLAEAAICGNALFGYTGLGGQEIFDIATKYSLSFPSPTGDLSSIIQNIRFFVSGFDPNDSNYGARIFDFSKEVSSTYNSSMMRSSLHAALALYFA